MSLQFCSLSSGSSGNCYFIGNHDTFLLVDAGISTKKITTALSTLEQCPQKISGLLITHEHSDHVKSIETLCKKYNIPIYINQPTWDALMPTLKHPGNVKIHFFVTGMPFYIGNIKIHPFPIPHDAMDPVGFSFYYDDTQISTATDMGHMTDEILEEIQNADILVLEANHDIDMLKIGKYPWFLKQRILGQSGHLSNEAAGDTIAKIFEQKPKRRQILLAHLSKDNNFPQMAYQTVKNILEEKEIYVGKHLTLDTIIRDHTSRLYRKELIKHGK